MRSSRMYLKCALRACLIFQAFPVGAWLAGKMPSASPLPKPALATRTCHNTAAKAKTGPDGHNAEEGTHVEVEVVGYEGVAEGGGHHSDSNIERQRRVANFFERLDEQERQERRRERERALAEIMKAQLRSEEERESK
jgi:hypothetical protein